MLNSETLLTEWMLWISRFIADFQGVLMLGTLRCRSCVLAADLGFIRVTPRPPPDFKGSVEQMKSIWVWWWHVWCSYLAWSRCLTNMSRSEVFALTACCHASLQLISAPNSEDLRVFISLRFWFSLSKSARLACGPLFSYVSRADRFSLSHCWHNWPWGRLLAWHKGGVPSPNLTHLLVLLAAMMCVK